MNEALVIVLVLAVVIAIVRLALQQRALAPDRKTTLRFALLVALQPLCATLLYLTLLPAGSRSTETLVVVTRHGRTVLSGNNLVAMPEAIEIAGAERVPDLATALRRYPPARLKIVGDGLEARDIDAVKNLPVVFAPTRQPSGIVRLDYPPPVAPGAAFTVGGRVAGVTNASVDFLDPAGRRVDTATPDKAGDFVVSATARAAGYTQFTLRVRAGSGIVEEATIPENTVSAKPLHVFLLAGAPGPEVKYLRRWATAGGMDVLSRFGTGGGLAIGDVVPRLSEATLRTVDLLLVDERSWTALDPGERQATISAVRAGLGVLVRIDGPLTETERAALRALGFTVATGSDASTFIVPSARVDATGRAAREGPGTADAPAGLNRDATVPALTLWSAHISGTGSSPLLRDAHGVPVAPWRAEGLGRIALWPIDNSFRLVLAGADASYDELWSRAFATLGRGTPRRTLRIDQPAWLGQRVAVCGANSGAVVVGPDGRSTPLIDDPVAGCAGFWPRTSGRYEVRSNGDGVGSPFMVLAADALPNVRSQATRDATLALAAKRASRSNAAVTTRLPGGAWAWAVAWLLATSALGWFERSRRRQARP